MAPIDHTCRPITPEVPGFRELAREARTEGFGFLDRLDREWANGRNRFDQAGECLLGLFEGGVLVAVGGLNRDPYANDPGTGRIRHLYVSPNRRRAGLATRLMLELLLRGGLAFERLRLRTENPATGRFYETLGFSPTGEPDATHTWSRPNRSGC
jgi:ribosomal protein S18 acetylase RimI-like enzyme